MQGGKFHAHLATQGGVQVRKRLVEQEHLGVADNGATDGHTLALAAGELSGLVMQIRFQLERMGDVLDLFAALGFRHSGQFEAELHVFVHVHMRVERIGLENHCQTTLARFDIIHALPVDQEIAGCDVLKPCDHAQECGFSAA